jgi:VWFA-related protein
MEFDMKQTIFTATILALVLAGPASLSAQEPTETFTDRVDVAEVLLDVLVKDREGNVILGLGPDDFLVEEDGSTVDLEAATFYSNRVLVDEAASRGELKVPKEEIPVDRYFILFFHDDPGAAPLVHRERQIAARQARDWVRTRLAPPNDYVAVVRYTKRLLIHQDFTSDIEEILAALDDVARSRDPGGNWPSRIEAEEGPSLRRYLPQGDELRDETTRIYSALEVLARAAGHVVGRKNLVLYSIGFGELERPGFIVPDRRYYADTYRTLNDNNVAVYGVSMLRATNVSTPAGASYDSALTALSSDTGGRHYRNFVNYAVPLSEIVDDNTGYYLLSYRSEIPVGESGYREVTISTRNPDFVVRGRQGYWFGN